MHGIVREGGRERVSRWHRTCHHGSRKLVPTCRSPNCNNPEVLNSHAEVIGMQFSVTLVLLQR